MHVLVLTIEWSYYVHRTNTIISTSGFRCCWRKVAASFFMLITYFQCVSLSRFSAALQVRQQLESKDIFVCSLYGVFCVHSVKVHERLPLFAHRYAITPKKTGIFKTPLWGYFRSLFQNVVLDRPLNRTTMKVMEAVTTFAHVKCFQSLCCSTYGPSSLGSCDSQYLAAHCVTHVAAVHVRMQVPSDCPTAARVIVCSGATRWLNIWQKYARILTVSSASLVLPIAY